MANETRSYRLTYLYRPNIWVVFETSILWRFAQALTKWILLVMCPVLYIEMVRLPPAILSAPASITSTSSSPRTTRLVTILWWKPARCNGARCLWNIGIERWFLLLAAWYIGLKSLTLLAPDKQLDLWHCAGKVSGSDHLHWHRISAWSVWTVDTPWRLETLTCLILPQTISKTMLQYWKVLFKQKGCVRTVLTVSGEALGDAGRDWCSRTFWPFWNC